MAILILKLDLPMRAKTANRVKKEKIICLFMLTIVGKVLRLNLCSCCLDTKMRPKLSDYSDF